MICRTIDQFQRRRITDMTDGPNHQSLAGARTGDVTDATLLRRQRFKNSVNYTVDVLHANLMYHSQSDFNVQTFTR